MTAAKRATVPHFCYALHVAGVLRATCSTHFWVPIEQAPARRLEVVR